MRRIASRAVTLIVLAGCARTGPGAAGDTERADSAPAARAGGALLEFAGEFTTGSDARAGIAAMLNVNASGRGPASGQRLQILVHGADRLPPGTYTLAPPRAPLGAEPASPRVSALLQRTDSVFLRLFVSREGTLVLSVSDPSRLEGVVRFAAAEYCAARTDGRPEQRGPCRAQLVRPDAPAIEVSARFTATPESPKTVVPAR
jgi:hypothetical protein